MELALCHASSMAQCSSLKITDYAKRMQKNNSNKHLMKHNHDKKSTCCPPKTCCRPLPRDLVKKLHLDIGKNL